MNSNNNQLKIGSLLSYLQMFVGALVSVLYTPIMLKLLGQSEYGLYNTVASAISMLSLLSMGFNSGYIRYYSKYKKDDDNESIWKLNGLFIIIFTIIGTIALLCGIFLSFNLKIVFSEGLTEGEYQIAKILTLLLTCELAISFPMSVFSNIVSANEKFIFLKLVSIVKTVLSPLVTLPLLLMGLRSVAMVTVTLVISVATDAIYMYYVIRKLNNRFVFRGFEKGMFLSLFSYTAFIAVNLIVDQINWNVDKILLGRYKGTEVVAVYSVGYTLFQYYMMFSTSISSVFTPKIHRIVRETEGFPEVRRRTLTELFVKVGRIQYILLALVASGTVFFGKDFITKYWAGPEYRNSYYVALLLILPATVALIQNIGIEVQRAENKHKFRSLVYTAMAIVNVAISVILCQKYGAVGSAVGTAISLIIANGIVMNIYYHLHCDINIIFFWRSIAKLSLGLIIPILCGIVINRYIAPANLWNYLASMIIYVAVYFTSMWYIGMNETEKAMFVSPLKRITGKLYDRNYK